MNETAYSTNDPDTVAAYRKAVADRAAAGKRIAAGLVALGAGPRVFMRTSGFAGIPNSVTAIEQEGDHVPDGWRVVRGNLEPRRGKPGDAARQWLADHQPVDVRDVMEPHGLPRASWIPSGFGGYRIVSPEFFEHDGVLWARYEGEPGATDSGFDTKCAWDRVRLSEFHAAREAYAMASDLNAAAVA